MGHDLENAWNVLHARIRAREDYQKWYADHLARFHNGQVPYTGAIGGMLKFELFPTSVATVMKVRCVLSKCQNEKPLDISDYESW